jgi:hypothetical protein
MSTEYLTIGDKKLAIALNWKEIEGNSKRKLEANLRTLSIKSKVKYGALSPTIHEKTSQYVLIDTNDDFTSEKTYPAASFLADSLKGFIFIKQIESSLGNNKYWVCSVDSDGLIVEDGDLVIEGDEDLDDYVLEMVDLAGLKIATFEDDEQDVYPDSFNIERKITKEFFDVFDDLNYIQIKLYHIEKKSYTKYIAAIVGAITLSTGSYMYLKDDSLYQSIIESEYASSSAKHVSTLSKWKKINKKNKKKKIYNQDGFVYLGKSQIRDLFESQFYTNKEVIENLSTMETMLPDFNVEWTLTKIAYTKNQFIAIYKKIPESIGVYTELDYSILQLAKKHNYNIKPVALESNGNTRIYSVSFDDSNRKNKFLSRKLEEESEISKEDLIKGLEKKVSIVRQQASEITMKVNQFNMFEKAFSSEIENYYEELMVHGNKLNKIYKNIVAEVKKAPPAFDLSDGILDGDKMNYIEMAQRKVTFKWSYPNKFVKYPVVKSNSNKKLTPYALSYEITSGNIDGLTDDFESLIEASNYIDAPYMIFNSVEFRNETNQWVIRSSLFEKF